MKSIVGEADFVWKDPFGLDMAEIVTHVDKVGARCSDILGDCDGLFQGKVRGMRSMAQGVQHKHLRATGGFPRCRGHFLAVGVVGKQLSLPVGKDQARSAHPAMGKFHRDNPKTADLERPLEGHGHRAHVGADFLLRMEGILKDPCQILQRVWGSINRHRTISHFTIPPQVVESQDVVRVGVGVNDRIDPLDLFPQALGAKIWRRVHLDAGFPEAQQCRGAETLVTRIFRQADPAGTADHGNAMGRACPQECDFKFAHLFLSGQHTGILHTMSATLTSLRIRNLALVEELTWEPQPGFTAVTGETGAGKSVILGALGLLLGDRADRNLIRSGADVCSVEAVFEQVLDPRVAEVLEQGGAEACEENRLLLKRTIQSEGAGRQFANGSPCTLALLRALGDLLVDLHGPHDHQSLFSRDHQTCLLDAFASAKKLRDAYAEDRRALLALLREKEGLSTDGGALHRELDLLTHQVEEIEAAELTAEEEEVLVHKHRAASNAARILEACAELETRISGDEFSLSTGTSEVVRTTREIAKLDPAAEPLARAAETAAEAVRELSEALRHYAGAFESDPASLAAIESRLDLLGSLKRKYGSTIEEILAFGQQAKNHLHEIHEKIERSGSLDKEINSAQERLLKSGKALTSKRQSAAAKLEKFVSAALSDLGFAKCGFAVCLETSDPPGPLGLELAEFVFTPNPGEDPRPLRAIASSGEISRVMLALKGSLAEQDDIPLLVFDEIDANVGGEIAGKVASRMRDLARGRQVLCITHLPQVAAAAHHHFVVKKEVVGGRTRTLLESCSGPARTAEIARMLGGQSVTALAHANELLSDRS